MKKTVALSSLAVAAVAFLLKPEPVSIDKLLALPEDKVDIGLTALALCRTAYPHINPRTYAKKIHRVSRKVKALVAGSKDPVTRLAYMNQVIFKDEGYDYDPTSLSTGKLEANFLNNVLDTRMGNCYTLPLFYLAVAQDLGYPIYPVIAPGHCFLRYVEPGGKVYNIETTFHGRTGPDESYIRNFSIPKEAIEAGAYMRTLSYREFLAVMLDTSSDAFEGRGQIKEAIFFLKKAIELDPRCADCYKDLSRCESMMASLTDGDEAIAYFDQSGLHDEAARKLHYTPLESTAIWKELTEEK